VKSEQRVKISGTGGYLPARRVTNDDLAAELDTSHDWIVSHTGICARHIMAADESPCDMAERAARVALERAGVAAADLGYIIVATTTQDYSGFPSTACLLQGRLGATQAGALDISAACTGFVYSLEVARGLMHCDRGARPTLVVGVEAMSRIVDWKDRNTCVLFGDGAGAAVLELTSEAGRGILASYLRAEGSNPDTLYCGGGLRTQPPVTEARIAHMNGRVVFGFAVKAMAEVVLHFLETLQLSPEQVSFVVPHQANIRILQAAQKRLPIAPEKFFMNIAEVANTSAASIPLALAELDRSGRLRAGDLVITTGFGAGLTYGGNAILW
jgi:3-oxoacyl-[acyl-carrier-protein] synthase-3